MAFVDLETLSVMADKLRFYRITDIFGVRMSNPRLGGRCASS